MVKSANFLERARTDAKIGKVRDMLGLNPAFAQKLIDRFLNRGPSVEKLSKSVADQQIYEAHTLLFELLTLDQRHEEAGKYGISGEGMKFWIWSDPEPVLPDLTIRARSVFGKIR